MTHSPRVLIVGAGPTGLTAAVELARMGIIPVVIERRKTPSNLSRAVGILPSSMDIFAASGVDIPIRAQAIPFESFIAHDHGKVFANVKLAGVEGRNNHIFGLAQDQTEKHLRDKLIELGGDITYGAEFFSLAQDDSGISVSILGEAFRFDIVIGADGTQSTVRDALRIPYKGIDLPQDWSISDVDASDWQNPKSFQAFLLPKGHVVVVAPLEAERFRIISNTPDCLDSLPVPMNIRKIRRKAQFKISIRQAETYQKGRVFLAGDAAHCHSPVGGRGMNLGISDAACLTRRIIHGDLDGYTSERHAIGAKTLKQSEQGRKIVTSTNPVARFLLRSVLRTAQNYSSAQRAFVQRALDL